MDEKKSNFDRLSVWVPEDLKADYWRSLAHLKSIPPEDEIFNLMEVLGVVATVTRQVPGELAMERTKFREEQLAILAETRKLLDAATAQAVTGAQAIEQINATARATLKGLEKTTLALQNAAQVVDVKSISDRLNRSIHDSSIQPITAMNEKLEVTRTQLMGLAQVTQNMVHVLRKARWWIPWVAAFSISGAIFTYAWYSLQTSLDQRASETHTIRKRPHGSG